MDSLNRGNKVSGTPGGDPENETISGSENEPRNQVINDRTSCWSLPLYGAIQPIIISMKLFGLFFHNGCSAAGFTQAGISTCSLARIYNVSLIVILFLNLIRQMTVFNGSDGFGSVLFSKIVFLAWITLCFINYCCMHYACSDSSALESFFKTWHQINTTREVNDLKFFRKRAIAYTMTAWIAYCFNIAFGVYGTLYSFAFDDALAPLTPESEYALYMRIVYVIIHIFLTAGWVFVGVFALFTISVTCYEFKKFNKEFLTHVTLQQEFRGDFEHFRQWHLRICQLVSYGDNSFSANVACTIGSNMVIVIMILHNLIWYPQILQDGIVAFMTCFWFAYAIISLMLISVWAAKVNSQVSSF